MPPKVELVEASFGEDTQTEIRHFIHSQLEWLISAHRQLHDTNIPLWRRLYHGVPAEKTKNFPFPNCANTIVQVVGETVDSMVARVMGLVYATHPLWVFQNYIKGASMDEDKVGEARRVAIEQFMEIVGMEPAELDLQRTEAQWFTDAAKLGTAFVKAGLEEMIEAVVTGKRDKGWEGEDQLVYSGPRVTKLRHEDLLADPSAQTLDHAGFVAVKHALYRSDLIDRKNRKIYPAAMVSNLLKSPDRGGFAEQQRQELMDQGITSPTYPAASEQWDLYECYFPWWNNGRKYRVIYTYHMKSRQVLRKVFNFLPDNELPVKRAKLGYRTDGLYGEGYGKIFESYQEELSTTHNQRLDNATVANVRALRVSQRARTLDANMELYPGALLVGEKDDIEAIAIGDVYPSTFKNEEMTLGLVARRAGITPAVSGSGSGSMQKRPAVYSSQGTLAVMQENNSQVGFATSEFRHAHVILGSMLTALYGKFGTDGREQMFGLNAERLTEALEEFSKKRMRIPIRASSGSLNKEVDKQTGIVVTGLMQRHYTAVAQVLQAINNPIVPDGVKSYLVNVVQASEMLHKRVMKDFGYEQPDLYVPEAKVSDGAGQGQAPGAVQPGQVAPGQPPAQANGAPPGGGGNGVVPSSGLAGLLASGGAVPQ